MLNGKGQSHHVDAVALQHTLVNAVDVDLDVIPNQAVARTLRLRDNVQGKPTSTGGGLPRARRICLHVLHLLVLCLQNKCP